MLNTRFINVNLKHVYQISHRPVLEGNVRFIKENKKTLPEDLELSPFLNKLFGRGGVRKFWR